MPDSRDYPLVQTLGTGNLMHHARPADLPGRVETRCGMDGERTDRDGSFWCPDCLALERTKTGTHDGRAGDADPYDWDPVYAAATIDRLQKALAAATARAESATVLHERWKALRVERDAANKRAEKAEAERDELRAAIVANGSLDFLATLAVKIEGTSAADFKRIVAFRKSGGAPPDGRSEPVERSETSGGIGTASNSSTGTAGLSAACGNKYSYHVCFLPAGHDGDHRDDRYWRWPTHLGTWTSDDATEDGQHG